MVSIANNTYSCASGETIYVGRTGAVPIAIFINGMSPGTWAEYTGTNINERVVYPDQPVQADAPFSALESSANLPFTAWANKFAFDPVSKQIGGIGTAQGYSSESPAGTHGKCLWFDLADNAFYQDWNPNGRNEGHIYDGTTSRALNGFIYHRGFGANIIHKCDVSTRVWSSSGLSWSGIYNADAAGLEVFPDKGENGSLFIVNGVANQGRVYSWDLATGTRTDYGENFDTGDYPIAFYCQALESIIFGGGSTSTGKLYKFSKTGVITQIPTTFPVWMGSANAGPFLPDPSGAAKAWFICHSLNKVFSVDLNTGTWTDHGAVPGGLSGNISYCVGISLTGLGALALLWGSGRGGDGATYSKFWLYKV